MQPSLGYWLPNHLYAHCLKGDGTFSQTGYDYQKFHQWKLAYYALLRRQGVVLEPRVDSRYKVYLSLRFILLSMSLGWSPDEAHHYVVKEVQDTERRTIVHPYYSTNVLPSESGDDNTHANTGTGTGTHADTDTHAGNRVGRPDYNKVGMSEIDRGDRQT